MSLTSSSIAELTKVRDNLIATAKSLEARVVNAITSQDVEWAKIELGALKEKLAEIEVDLGIEPAAEAEPAAK